MVQLFNALKDAGVPVEPTFPREEYETRVAQVRKAMEEQEIDVLLVHHTPNFCYLAGFQTPLANWYGCLILPREGEPIAQIMDVEVANLMVHGWDNENIHVFDWRQQIEAPSQLASILQDRGFGNKRIGLESRLPGCSGHTEQRLRELLPQAHIGDASDLVLYFRAAKSPLEMAYVREAARLSDIGMQAALEVMALGNTENDVHAAAHAAMTRAGSEYNSIEPVVSSGYASGMVHQKTKRRVLKLGDAVEILLSGYYERYSAPIKRTGVIGQPSELVKRMTEYNLTTLALLFENVRPGRSGSDVARAVVESLKTLDLRVEGTDIGSYDIGLGYTVGIGFPPDWVEHSMFVDKDCDRLLEEGMVFHTPINARARGKVGVGFSETWVVTATGCETLSKLPRELTVVSA